MTRRLRLGEGTDQIDGTAASSFAFPTASDSAGGLSITAWTRGRCRPADVIISLLANGACAFDKAAGLVGLQPNGRLSLLEGPLFGGSLISFISSTVARDFAVAVGGYTKIWLVAFDGTTLGVTLSKTVVFSALPAYSVEG